MNGNSFRGLAALVVAFAATMLVAGPASAAVKAQLNGATVTITGDGADDKIAITDDPTRLFVDVGEDGTTDFSFDRSTFTALSVASGGGNDDVRFVPGIFAGIAVKVDGGAGDDTIVGSDADEVLLGGGGNDFVDGNRGSDTVDLGGGNDTFQWDPGDGSDVLAGGTGRDLLDFNGSNAAERIALAANGSGVVLTRDVAAITTDTTGLETFAIRTLGSVDTVHVGDLTGTSVREVDVALGAFDGTGDLAADTVVTDGTDGADPARVATGSDGSTFVKGLAVQTHVTGGEPALDKLEFDGLGGDDSIDGGVAVPGALPVLFSGGPGSDVATFNGTSGDDSIGIATVGSAAIAFAAGATPLEVDNTDERLVVSGGAGNDTIAGQNGISGFAPLEIDGGIGNDTLAGGDGDDTILAGPGDDLVDGNRGSDTVDLGTGNDHFQWDPGDGSDVVDGGGGADVLDFNGSNAAEQIDLSNDGGSFRLHRDVADVTTETANVERVALRTLGSADIVRVGDLSGTAVGEVDVNLAAFDGTGDGAADTVIVAGTGGADAMKVGASGSTVTVDGLAARTTITGAEPALDALAVLTGAGRDSVAVDPAAQALIGVSVDLGTDQ